MLFRPLMPVLVGMILLSVLPKPSEALIIYEEMSTVSIADEAIRRDPADAVAFYERGRLFYDEKAYPRAIADFSEAIRLETGWALPYNARGAAYKLSGDLHRALSDLNEAIRLDSTNEYSYRHRADTFARLRSYDQAIADLNEVIRTDPSEDVYFERGQIHQEMGNNDQAILDFDEAIRQDDQMADAYKSRADAYRAKRDDRAIADYSEATRINPQLTRAFFWRGLLYTGRGDYDSAIADYDAALRLRSDEEVYFSRGRTLYYQGRFLEAATSLSKAAERDNDMYVALWMYLVESRIGRSAEQEVLAAAANQFDLEKWPGPIIRLFLKRGSLKEVEIGATAGSPEEQKAQHCEAQFYVGANLLTIGSADEGTLRLRRAAEVCEWTFMESEAAKAELRRLGK